MMNGGLAKHRLFFSLKNDVSVLQAFDYNMIYKLSLKENENE